jgi:hypothetical protein
MQSNCTGNSARCIVDILTCSTCQRQKRATVCQQNSSFSCALFLIVDYSASTGQPVQHSQYSSVHIHHPPAPSSSITDRDIMELSEAPLTRPDAGSLSPGAPAPAPVPARCPALAAARRAARLRELDSNPVKFAYALSSRKVQVHNHQM